MSILGIDPGPLFTAWCLLGADGLPIHFGKEPTDQVIKVIEDAEAERATIVCEFPACYGQRVGEEIFETCFVAGRFNEHARNMLKAYRMDIRLHFCASARGNDAAISRVIKDRFRRLYKLDTTRALIGTKKTPGPLRGMVRDMWQALAVACYWHDSAGNVARNANSPAFSH